MKNLTKLSAHLSKLTLGTIEIFYSYNTIVAFYTVEHDLCVSENVWSVTTGRHLTQIDGGSKEAKAKRLPRTEFEEALGKLGA